MRSHVVTARAPRAADRPSLARRTLFALACASGLTAAQPAAAAFWSSDAPPERATAMAEGAGHAGPRAHRAMCARAPALCAPDIAAGRRPEAGAMPAMLDAEDWRRVRALNLALN
ncbi:MAG: hypothetical protein RQ752_13780, partial [Thermohalobaculum sp.]|nr:hypothetical protein [Thermohalobaculum sp.]